MKTILAAGVFDYMHPGHLFFLESAKNLGNRLVVIVARDKNVQRIKDLTPHHSEDKRKEMVEQSNIADEVFLGNEKGSFLDIVQIIKPDILALGYDQKLPNGFLKTFPDVQVIHIPAKNPTEWKSSRFREKTKT